MGKRDITGKYDIHPDFLKYNFTPPLHPLLLPLMQRVMQQMLDKIPLPAGLKEAQYTIKGYGGAPIRLSVFEPGDARGPMPALVCFHGGAFALKAAPHHKKLAFQYALQTPCKVVFVDYRLLPKYAFPVGLEDCYAALRWTQEQAGTLGIDPARIAVGGDSAGGTLAIGVCMLARDRGTPMPCFQMLVYPATDERQNTGSMHEFDDTPLWNSRANAKLWKMYLKNGVPGKREYASPAEAASLKGMPPAYVEVSEYDCLRDEGIAFAGMLARDGVATVLNKTKRTVHGFEVAEHNEIVQESLGRRVEALRGGFGLL